MPPRTTPRITLKRHRHQADRHRGLRAVHDAGPLIAAQAVGAQEEDALRRIGRGDQMEVALEQAEHAVGEAGGEEADRHLLLRIGRPFHAQGRRVALADDGRHPGRERPSSKKCTVCTGMKACRASVRSGSWVEKKSGTGRSGRGRSAGRRSPSPGDGGGSATTPAASWRRRRRDPRPPCRRRLGDRGAAVAIYFSTRMRGSISASRTSDTRVPTMVRNE